MIYNYLCHIYAALRNFYNIIPEIRVPFSRPHPVVLGRCSQTSVLPLAGSLPINDRQNLSKTDIC